MDQPTPPVTAGAICIGRNVGALPMPTRTWADFIAAVEAVVRQRGGVVYTVAYGVGEWDGELEDTVVVTFDEADMTAVMADLAQLASRFEQEAIALLQGQSVLIYQSRPMASDTPAWQATP